jgi:hypothetical protein
MPLQWGRTAATLAEAAMAARKVSWRALLSVMLSHESEEQPLLSGRTRHLKRLGRLNDSAYRSWKTFLDVVEERLEVKVTGISRDRAQESRLEVFHFLRCALGPVVESFLLLDRKLWLQEQLKVSPRCVISRHRYSGEAFVGSGDEVEGPPRESVRPRVG